MLDIKKLENIFKDETDDALDIIKQFDDYYNFKVRYNEDCVEFSFEHSGFDFEVLVAQNGDLSVTVSRFVTTSNRTAIYPYTEEYEKSYDYYELDWYEIEDTLKEIIDSYSN